MRYSSGATYIVGSIVTGKLYCILRWSKARADYGYSTACDTRSRAYAGDGWSLLRSAAGNCEGYGVAGAVVVGDGNIIAAGDNRRRGAQGVERALRGIAFGRHGKDQCRTVGGIYIRQGSRAKIDGIAGRGKAAASNGNLSARRTGSRA